MAEQVRAAVLRVDSSQRVRRLRTMEDVVASTTAQSRFNASLFGIFAGVALAVAAIGVYGLLSFLVAQRRHEIGTRMALGACRADILRLFFKQGLLCTGLGLCVGVAGALLLTRWLSALLYGVQPNDPGSFAAVAAVLLLIGVAASYIPARRATKIDPMVALRNE
jgi:putative ABC transport system permease protein